MSELVTARSYAYQQLSREDSFRLITIRPGSRSEDLCIHLEEVMLQNKPKFEALSYAWSKEQLSAAVYVEQDKSRIHITPKLELALKHLRQQHEPRVVWVDAICIHQINDEEKAHQVALMSQIFSIAQQVVVWLEEAEESDTGSSDAIQCLRHLAEAADKFELKWDPDGRFCVLGHLQPDSPDDWTLDDVQDIVRRGKEASVLKLVRNVWFRRLWIVQEILLAQSATIVCGTDLLSWTQFARGLMLFGDAIRARRFSSSLEEQDMKSLQTAITIAKTRSTFRHWSQPNAIVLEPWSNAFILGVYETFRNQQCSDDRDRVFGLLALHGPEHLLTFKPDYSWTVHQTYKKFALSLFCNEQSGTRNLLSHAGLWHREDQSINLEISSPDYLPSWAPDFRPSKTTSRLPRTLRSCSFNTASNYNGATDHSRKDDNILTFRGKIFDDMLMLAECGPNFVATCGLMKQILGYWASLELEEYPTGENVIDAFLKTVVLGSDAVEIEYLKELWEGFRRVAFEDNKEQEESTLQKFYKLHLHMINTLEDDSCIVTNNGFFGIVPFASRIGDRIAIIAGSDVPFVVRWVEDLGLYLLVGACYIHGLMQEDDTNPAGDYVDGWISFA